MREFLRAFDWTCVAPFSAHTGPEAGPALKSPEHSIRLEAIFCLIPPELVQWPMRMVRQPDQSDSEDEHRDWPLGAGSSPQIGRQVRSRTQMACRG